MFTNLLARLRGLRLFWIRVSLRQADGSYTHQWRGYTTQEGFTSAKARIQRWVLAAKKTAVCVFSSLHSWEKVHVHAGRVLARCQKAWNWLQKKVVSLWNRVLAVFQSQSKTVTAGKLAPRGAASAASSSATSPTYPAASRQPVPHRPVLASA